MGTFRVCIKELHTHHVHDPVTLSALIMGEYNLILGTEGWGGAIYRKLQNVAGSKKYFDILRIVDNASLKTMHVVVLRFSTG